jgi:hypothetical protein
VADVKLAGDDYKLFLRPVDLSIPQTGANDGHSLRWVVIGLEPAARFRREVWAISYSVLIVFAFLTALSILSWPFLKFLLIGPKDRLRTADIYFLFFSTLIGLALLTFLGLYTYSYKTLETDMNRQLETLASTVKKNFQAEVKASLKQLDALNRDPASARDLSDLSCTSRDASGSVEKEKSSAERRSRLEILEGQSPTPTPSPYPHVAADADYPYFNTAVWIDGEGRQRLKWTIEKYPPRFVDVSDRSYFKNLKEGHYRYLNDLSDHKFWLDPIISKTTGRNEVEISEWRPAEPGGTGNAPGDAQNSAPSKQSCWISAFDTRPLSLMQPVLPAGFGFSVIDEEGRVLFHSDENHLGENFFEESDNDSSLRSAVVDRREMILDVSYMGRGHSLFTTPMENFAGWTLITFRDKQVLRTAFLELLTLLSILFLGYCVIILFFLSVLYLVNLNTNERRTWLWPSSRRTFSYYVSMLGLLALSIVSARIYCIGGPRSVIAVGLISFVGMCLFFLNLRFGRYGRNWKGVKESGLWGRTQTARKRFYRYDLGYVLNIVILFLLVAIIPAAAFFKFAYESEMRLFIMHGQITMAKGLAVRDERIRSQYAGRWREDDEKFRDAFIEKRLDQTWDIYDEFFFYPTSRQLTDGGLFTSKQGPPPDSKNSGAIGSFFCLREPANFISCLYDSMPRYNRTSTERLGLNSGAFADNSYKWEENQTCIALHIKDERRSNSETAQPVFVTAILSFSGPGFSWPDILWWMPFFLACWPFYLWMRLAVKKIFLLNLHGPTSYSFASLVAGEAGDNLFVILDPPFTQSRNLDGERFHCLRMRDVSGSPGWAEVFDYDALPGGDKLIALDEFEHEAGDPAANRQKAQFLKELLRRGRRMFVISTIEPSRYYFADGPDGARSCEDLDIWSGLVSNLFTVYAEDQGEAEWFVEKVEEENQKLLSNGSWGDRPREEREDLLAALKEECSPKAVLQRLGLEIPRHPDFVKLTRAHLIGRIRNQAGLYYRDIWTISSNEEKLTLFHLAQDKLLSPNDPEIATLLRKGLIVRDPDVHLMNESFRQFVKSDGCARDVAECEKEAKKDSLWHIMKPPLLVVLISVVLFLFITQRDLYTSSLAIMTAITTAIPALFKVLSLFQKDPVQPPSPQ